MRGLLQRLKTERGFTLVEMMVLIGILGVILTIAVPTITDNIARQQVVGSARELRSVLRNARSAAINEGMPHYVLLRPGTPGTYQLYRFNDSAWTHAGPEVPLKGQVAFTASDVTVPGLADAPIAGANVPEDAVYFDTRGRYPIGHSGTYTIRLRAQAGDPVTLSFYPQTGQVTGP